MSLRIRNLSFLDWTDLSIEAQPGEVLAIMGESGSGKSLLLRAVADLIVSEGEVSLDDSLCDSMEPTAWRTSVGYMPAEVLWWEESVGEHFVGQPSAAALERLGLKEECLSWRPNRLSMGERQRLGLLRLLDRKPKALLLDEPTANLDGAAAEKVESLLLEYIEEHRTPTLWVTHSEEQAKRVASRVYRFADKRLAEVEGGAGS